MIDVLNVEQSSLMRPKRFKPFFIVAIAGQARRCEGSRVLGCSRETHAGSTTSNSSATYFREALSKSQVVQGPKILCESTTPPAGTDFPVDANIRVRISAARVLRLSFIGTVALRTHAPKERETFAIFIVYIRIPNKNLHATVI